MNQVTLSGNVATEPRRTRTNNGDTMFSTRLAVYSGKGKDGQQETMFIDVTMFSVKDWMEGDLSRIGKGSPIVVTGRLRLNRYQNKEGQMVDSLSVVADSINALMSRNAEPMAQATSNDTDPFA